MEATIPTDPAGNFSLVPSYFAQPGTAIRTEQHNPVLEDIAEAISGRLMRDGRNPMVGALNMNGFPIQNVGPGTGASSVASVAQTTPIGSVIDYAGAVAPEGWLLCFGQEVSRSAYSALFSAIGTTYGTGNGSTTFNLPDCRGRVTAGRDNMGGTDAGRLTKILSSRNLGGTGGVQEHTLTVAQMPAHSHSGTTSTNGAHSHSMSSGDTAGWGTNVDGTPQSNRTLNTNSAGAHNHTFTTNSVGGDQPHPNVQPTIIFNKIIRATY